MRKMTNAEPLDISVFGMPLKVFRIGKTPGIKYHHDPDEIPASIRSVHSHFTYEVFFVTEGPLKLITEENAEVFQKKVLIIPPKIRHYSIPSGEGSYCLLFSFEEGKKQNKWQSEIEARLRDGVCQLPLSEDIAFYIRKIAEKCTQTGVAVEKEEALLASLIFYEIIGQLLPESYGRQSQGAGSAKHIYEIETYINFNINKKQRITLSDVAKHISLSTRQVSRIIQKEYNCTLGELITDKKLAAAEMLIKNTDMPVGEIARQANLGSDNYFYTLFKKRYGISPLQYRKQKRG